jgi:hypothetical protein
MVEKVGEIWLEDRMAPKPEVPVETVVPGPQRPEPVVAVFLSAGDQAAFVGEYYGEELNATYRVFREGDSLMLDVNGAFTFPLERRGTDALAAGWLTLRYKMEGGRMVEFQVGSGRAGGVVFVRR